MGKSAKSSDRPVSPRQKNTKPKSLGSVLEDLQRLIDEQPTHDHFNDFITETNSEKNDRGAAILLATNVENALQIAILSMLRVRKGTSRLLFGVNSALGTFSNKISMAYAMDIFGDETKQNLDIIRTIRNAFAHSKIPIGFDTPIVKEACSRLVIPRSIPPTIVKGNLDHLEGRKRYQEVCNTTAHNLSIFARPALILLKVNAGDPLPQLPGNFEIYAKRPALP